MHSIEFDVDYPDVPRNRLTAAFRLVLVIPILVVLGTAAATGFADDGTELACRCC